MFLFNSHQMRVIVRPGSLCRFSVQSVFTLAVITCLCAALSGCPMEEEDSGDLNGTWLFNTSPAYIVDTSAGTVKYLGWDGDGYEGKISNTADFTAKNGVLIIEFTKYLQAVYNSNWELTGINEDPPGTVGYFGALYWKDLKSKSVKLADYWDFSAGAVHYMLPDLNEAKAYFISDRGAGIDWGISSYTK